MKNDIEITNAREHPLIIYYSNMNNNNAISFEKNDKSNDIILSEYAGKRFALENENNTLTLFCQQEDKEALSSIKWNTCAIILGRKNKDWIAFSCKDIRIEKNRNEEPVPLRFFIPVSDGRLAVIEKEMPERLEVKIMKLYKNEIIPLENSTFISLPILLKSINPLK